MSIEPNYNYNTDWYSSQYCVQQKQDAVIQGMNDPENQKVQKQTEAVYNSY